MKIDHNILSAWWILVEKQPSSCAAERVLSVFIRIMNDNMKNSPLIDVIECDNCDDYDDF